MCVSVFYMCCWNVVGVMLSGRLNVCCVLLRYVWICVMNGVSCVDDLISLVCVNVFFSLLMSDVGLLLNVIW